MGNSPTMDHLAKIYIDQVCTSSSEKKKHGRPVSLDQNLDTKVQLYLNLKEVRGGGGVVSPRIPRATGLGIVFL